MNAAESTPEPAPCVANIAGTLEGIQIRDADTAVLTVTIAVNDAASLGPLVDGRIVVGIGPTTSLPAIPGASIPELEKHAILETMKAVHWSTSEAAKILQISARTIQYRLATYGVRSPRNADRPRVPRPTNGSSKGEGDGI